MKMLSYTDDDGADDGDNDQRLMRWGLWWCDDINQIRMFTKNETVWGIWSFVVCLMIKCCQLWTGNRYPAVWYVCDMDTGAFMYSQSFLITSDVLWKLLEMFCNLDWFL